MSFRVRNEDSSLKRRSFVVLGWKKTKKNLKISNRSETGLTAPVPGFPVKPADFYCFVVFTLFAVF